MKNPFVKIFDGIQWVVKEVGKGFGLLPKLITLTDDAKRIASDVVPKILAVLDAVKNLVAASLKDGGVFMNDLNAIVSAIVTAASQEGVNVSSDEAVVAAIGKFVKDFNASNVADVLGAWKNLIVTTQALDATVEADLKKLEADV